VKNKKCGGRVRTPRREIKVGLQAPSYRSLLPHTVLRIFKRHLNATALVDTDIAVNVLKLAAGKLLDRWW
jgi:hypothetical protein